MKMVLHVRRYSPLMGTCVGLVFAATACQSPTVQAVPESSRNLRSIGLAYKKAIQEKGAPPSSAQDLMEYLKEYGEPEPMLRSPEDSEPYVILWGANPNVYPAVILAYEKQGKNGR